MCNFSGMIKNVLPSLRQGAACKGSAADKKASAAALPGTPSRKPRTCGEKMMKAGSNCAMLGSPPHMRGKVFQIHSLHGHAGITPAYAGKSRCACTRARSARVHPRTCGEKRALLLIAMCTSGSPPRMRGKVAFLDFVHVHAGITPAYAGKRYHSGRSEPYQQDHPRVCGEKPAIRLRRPLAQGSPPHVRGKVLGNIAASQRARITPACAGKSGRMSAGWMS